MSEQEVRYYWKLAQHLRDAERGTDPQALWEAIDDLEALVMHGSPPLAERARSLVASAQRVPEG